MNICFPNLVRVLPALLLSLLLHGLVFTLWPYLQAAASRPIIVQGELVAPKIEEPPARNEPSPPPPEPQPEPPPARELPILSKPEAPSPSPKQNPDTGIALPVLAEKADTPSSEPADYAVAEAPPLNPDDKLPFGSKVGATPLDRYTPPSGPAGEGGGSDSVAGNVEDPVDHDVLAEYGRGLRERAAQFGGYPPLAQKRGWQGRVKVLVRFARNGLPHQVNVKESSGHKVLDDQALEMVRQACKDFPLPQVLSGKAFSVVVPVDFKLV